MGANIRRLRLERGLSQEEVAHRVGVVSSYFSQIERGSRNPTVSVIGRVADVLQVPLTILVERND